MWLFVAYMFFCPHAGLEPWLTRFYGSYIVLLLFVGWEYGCSGVVSFFIGAACYARLLSWFVVQLMTDFSLIDSELTCWGLLDVHSPEGGPSNPPQ